MKKESILELGSKTALSVKTKNMVYTKGWRKQKPVRSWHIAPKKYTDKNALYILSVIWFSAAMIIMAAQGPIDEGEIRIQPARAETIEQSKQEWSPCGIPGVTGPDCPDETMPDGKGGMTPAEEAETMLEGTPMAGLGKAIVETAEAKGVNWRLVIGLAYAESGLGKHYYKAYDKDHCSNAWGIKPPQGRRADGSYLRCYNDWQSGINSIVGLLSRRYADQTPEQMCGVYVQPCHQNWLDNVNKFYKEN